VHLNTQVAAFKTEKEEGEPAVAEQGRRRRRRRRPAAAVPLAAE